MEVACLGLIHPTTTSLVPVALSATYKKDSGMIGESTQTVEFLISAIEHTYYKFGLNFLLGPLASFGSDGASAFSKGAGNCTSDTLPQEMRVVYIQSVFFNLVGGRKGTTRLCDLDHLGKRNRERGKGMKGCRIGNYCFDKIKLEKWFGLS